MTPDEREARDKRDLNFLTGRPEFSRFLLRVIQRARIFDRTADGSVGRDLAFHEGVRHLGLEILEMVEAGQPVPHPDGQPIFTLIRVLHEEANQPGGGKPNARRNDRDDRYAEFRGDDAND